MNSRIIWFSLVVALIAVVATGCSSEKKRQIVTGTISRGGQPLPHCSIRFHGPDGVLTTTNVGPDGTFTMTDVFPGEYKVTFQPEVEKGSGSAKKHKEAKPPAPLPAKYLNVTTTDLVYTIAPDTREIAVAVK